MRNRLSILLGLSLLANVAMAYDDHEIVTSITSGALSFRGSTTAVSVGGGYHYSISPPIQIGIVPSFGYVSAGGTSTTSLSILGGPTFNFPTNYSLSNAVFITGLLGFNHVSPAAGTSTRFAFGVEVGKRFALLAHFCYRPSFSMIKVTDFDATFVINFLSFAATF